jgi:hypothetical protein
VNAKNNTADFALFWCRLRSVLSVWLDRILWRLLLLGGHAGIHLDPANHSSNSGDDAAPTRADHSQRGKVDHSRGAGGLLLLLTLAVQWSHSLPFEPQLTKRTSLRRSPPATHTSSPSTTHTSSPSTTHTSSPPATHTTAHNLCDFSHQYCLACAMTPSRRLHVRCVCVFPRPNLTPGKLLLLVARKLLLLVARKLLLLVARMLLLLVARNRGPKRHQTWRRGRQHITLPTTRLGNQGRRRSQSRNRN